MTSEIGVSPAAADGRDVSQAPRILVVRPDNLGDVILFSGAFKLLRRRFGAMRICVVARRYAFNFLETNPAIDELIPWEDYAASSDARWLLRLRGGWRAYQWLRRRKLKHRAKSLSSDLVLFPVRFVVGGPDSMHDLVGAIPAARRYGIGGDRSLQCAQDDQKAANHYTARIGFSEAEHSEHAIATTRRFLALLGIDAKEDELWPDIYLANDDRRKAAEMAPTPDGSLSVALFAGVTSNAGKFLPGDFYASALRALGSERFSVSVFGSPDENQQCQQVYEALRSAPNVGRVRNLTGTTTARETAAALPLFDLVIAQETAAVHLATALRIPSICILGGGHFGLFYPWGDPAINRVVARRMSCYGCNWRCPFDSMKCIQDIASSTLAAEIRLLVESLRSRRGEPSLARQRKLLL